METLYTLITTGVLILKKCFLFNLLCPVYGLGAISIILVSKNIRDNKILTIIAGGIVATLVEYGFHYVYKDLLGVTMWSYNEYYFNVNGRICLLFSFYWCILSYILIYYIHPIIEKNIPYIPKSMCLAFMIFVGIDGILSILLYKHFGDKNAVSLFWLTSYFRKMH